MSKQFQLIYFITGLAFFFMIIQAVTWSHEEQIHKQAWSSHELEILASLMLDENVSEDALSFKVEDASNQYVTSELAAVLGHKLFFDTRLSINEKVACASCHQPDKYFTDGQTLAEAGISVTARHTPTVVGVSQSEWLFWDGRKDSLWSQALGPLENAAEHGGSRTQYAHVIDQFYRQEYEQVFGTLPDFSDLSRFPKQAGPTSGSMNQAWQMMREDDRRMVTAVFVNIGKAIAAYEVKLQPGPGRFDRYVSQLLASPVNTNNAHSNNTESILSEHEIAGLKLFIDDEKTRCIRCHNGPLFTNHDFQATAVPQTSSEPDSGRIQGVQQALNDEFNCFSQHSDAQVSECAELQFVKTSGIELKGAFKVPTLRNIYQTAPYMDKGQFKTLKRVLGYYNLASPRSNQSDGTNQHNELMPIRLFPHELKQLEAFLHTLNGGVAAEQKWLSCPFQLTNSYQKQIEES